MKIFKIRNIKKFCILGEGVSVKKLDSIDIASEENVKKYGGAIGWGGAGGVVLGPMGSLAGLLLGVEKRNYIRC